MNIRDKVAVIGAGCCKFGENYDLSTEDMVVAAASDAYADAKVEPSQIQAAWVGTLSSAMAGVRCGWGATRVRVRRSSSARCGR